MDKKVTLFPGMAGVTREMIDKMKTEGVELFSVDIIPDFALELSLGSEMVV